MNQLSQYTSVSSRLSCFLKKRHFSQQNINCAGELYSYLRILNQKISQSLRDVLTFVEQIFGSELVIQTAILFQRVKNYQSLSAEHIYALLSIMDLFLNDSPFLLQILYEKYGVNIHRINSLSIELLEQLNFNIFTTRQERSSIVQNFEL